MIISSNAWISILLIFGIATTLTAAAETADTAATGTSHVSRNTNANLVIISTRFVENYSKMQHKAGNSDGVFVEDVIIPSVVKVSDSYKGKIPPVVRSELYRFLIAGKSMASEELSALAAKIFLASPKQFCRDVSVLGKLDRRFLIKQAKDGLALSGTKFGKVECA